MYENILKLCERDGITGYRLCKECGIQPSVLSDLKMGRQSGLSAKNAAKIAGYFNVSVDYLLGNEDKKKEPVENDELREYLQAVHDRPQLKVLFKAGKNATPEKLDAILALLGEDKDAD